MCYLSQTILLLSNCPTLKARFDLRQIQTGIQRASRRRNTSVISTEPQSAESQRGKLVCPHASRNNEQLSLEGKDAEEKGPSCGVSACIN